jgi:hypothetical protein
MPMSAAHWPGTSVARKPHPASRGQVRQSPWPGNHLTTRPNGQLTASIQRWPFAISDRRPPLVPAWSKNFLPPLDFLGESRIIETSVPVRVRPPVTAVAAPPQGGATRQPGCTTSRSRDLSLPIASFSGRFGILFGSRRYSQTARFERGRG